MFKIKYPGRKRSNKEIRKIAEQEIRENMETIKSLRDYDAGKK